VKGLRVRCRFLSEFRDAAGRSEMEVEVGAGSSVSDLIARLCSELPGLQALFERVGGSGSPSFVVAVDGVEVPAHRREATVLREGSDVLFFFPGVGG